MRSVSSVQTKSRSKSSDEVWGWSKLISIVLREKQLEWFVVPVPASSSCGQRRGESQRWRPTACCGPATVGCLCRGPSGEGGGTWGVITQSWTSCFNDLFPFVPECIQLDCWKSAWPPSWLWRSSFCPAHLSHPCLSSTSRNHWWTPSGRETTDEGFPQNTPITCKMLSSESRSFDCLCCVFWLWLWFFAVRNKQLSMSSVMSQIAIGLTWLPLIIF